MTPTCCRCCSTSAAVVETELESRFKVGIGGNCLYLPYAYIVCWLRVEGKLVTAVPWIFAASTGANEPKRCTPYQPL